MHHLWPTGLILALVVALSGCAQHHAGDEHCSENDHFDCPRISSELESTGMFFVDQQILDTRSKHFVRHSGEGKYESYLVQNIPFEPLSDLRQKIEEQFDVSLKHRGEAHITVITPPEFERLSSHLSIDEINELASETIQSMTYQPVCLGRGRSRGQPPDEGTIMTTFFIVVTSRELVALREQIATAYRQAGGTEPAFKTQYHPHITLGFTHRDLHDSDGVTKDETSCVAGIGTVEKID
ncbi:MAG: 2'-5' RNA ligase family protein [Gammaproteobacteria bacterium]